MVKEELHLKMLIYAYTSWCISLQSQNSLNCLRQQKEEPCSVAAFKGAHIRIQFRLF